jgi:two-component system sensor histidine kinase SenX3
MTLWLTAERTPNGASMATIEDISERVRSDAMRRDFVANISHELKTPVGAIAVLAEALIDESDVEVVRRIAGRMIDESHRAVRAIDDLLELSWIEVAERTDEVVELRGVVQAAIARGRVADGGRGITVTSFDPVDVCLRADSRQLVSALGNLVENAVKYSHDGGEVQVRTLVSDSAVEIMVVDHGIGIPARDLDRIFERFYRVDKGRSRATGGTGLGLSIVRHVATNHGGEVLVSSREGEGSSFVLRLPAHLVVEAATEAPTAPHTAVSSGFASRQPDPDREEFGHG